MRIQPTTNNILVKIDKQEEVTTNSGLVLANSKEQDRGATLGMGIVQDGATELYPNKTRVLFKKESSFKINLQGEEYILLTESDIVAIITN